MNYVLIESFSNYIEANIILGRMKSADIKCWLKNENTTTIMPLWTTALGGIQLMVEDEDVPVALALLKQIKQEKKQAMVCPKCGGHDVEYINTMQEPVNWFSAAITFLLGDMALMPKQRYHCFKCGHEFKEIADKS